MKNILFSLLSVILLSSCTKTTQNIVADRDIPVVQSFLSPGSIPEIILSKVIYYSEDENDTVKYIGDANIYFHAENETYLMSEVDSAEGVYRYIGDDLELQSLAHYSFSFMYNDEEVSSSTTIPSKPENYHSSVNAVYLPRITEDGGWGGMPNLTNVDLSWDDFNSEYYLISVQYLEDTYDPVNANIEYEDLEAASNFTSPPTQDSTYTIRSRQFQFFGSYNVILMRITPEYADLYESISQSTLEGITEPNSNILNGKGIFAAFNSDTLWVEVKPL